MKLSVIILNYNVRYFLELCLRSAEAAISNMDAEIIVIDNNSSDDSCQMVKQLFPNIKLIENKSNDGFSTGNNIGIKQAQGEYLCILNPDTVVAEDTFEILLKFADATPNLGILGCKLIDGKGGFLPESKRNIPTPMVSIQKLFGYSKPYYAHHLKSDQTGKVSMLVGAFMIIKKSVYNEVGGLDEDYFMYGEDIDLSYKVLKAGYQNYYNSETTVIHFKGESTLKDKTYAKRFNGAMQLFFLKHFKPNWLFNIILWIGIKIISIFYPKGKESSNKINEYVFISNENHQQLQATLNKKITTQATIANYLPYYEYILDTDFLDFKKTIDIVAKNNTKHPSTFKFLLKTSQVILGSNTSKSRGEVIHIKNN
ncbi:glycosyltransferase family 2 protein [Xanthomarina sp. F2636L]|uniref:glycosyltransferase family 2 protein n=1 Tax=Xanthomarina sp. F2636L TaxID=2996018 RepID=UPI00225DEFFF|nr:glycosyltransferase family 2 protein [Xanthomarina sp. F2636L]MCX7549296.1 glycosyltransferase family 2 protein [Xanthomarina sp. F2636L]